LASHYPNLFAALVPICGGYRETDSLKRDEAVNAIKHMPIWIFHSKGDTIVPFSESEKMYKSLLEVGAKNIQFTVYEDNLHDSWTQTYNNPKMWQWLFSQSIHST